MDDERAASRSTSGRCGTSRAAWSATPRSAPRGPAPAPRAPGTGRTAPIRAPARPPPAASARYALESQERRQHRLGAGGRDRAHASATASPAERCSGGTNTTVTASTSGSSTALRSAAANAAPPASTPMSSSRVSRSPSATHALATSTPMAVELPTTATRSPAGSGCVERSSAMSNMPLDGLDPDDPGRLEQRPRADVGHLDRGLREPRDRRRAVPLLTATIGLCGPGGGSAGRTCAGCRSSRGTSGRRRCARRSPSTAAGRCPRRRRGCRPTRTSRPRARAGPPRPGWWTPSAPDWREEPHPPRQRRQRGQRRVQPHGGVGVDDAEQQFGPTTRMPCARADATRVGLRLHDLSSTFGVGAALAEPAGDP